jgi:hypothetical protein
MGKFRRIYGVKKIKYPRKNKVSLYLTLHLILPDPFQIFIIQEQMLRLFITVINGLICSFFFKVKISPKNCIFLIHFDLLYTNPVISFIIIFILFFSSSKFLIIFLLCHFSLFLPSNSKVSATVLYVLINP